MIQLRANVIRGDAEPFAACDSGGADEDRSNQWALSRFILELFNSVRRLFRGLVYLSKTAEGYEGDQEETTRSSPGM